MVKLPFITPERFNELPPSEILVQIWESDIFFTQKYPMSVWKFVFQKRIELENWAIFYWKDHKVLRHTTSQHSVTRRSVTTQWYSASSSKARKTRFCKRTSFISTQQWPPHLPNLNPMNFQEDWHIRICPNFHNHQKMWQRFQYQLFYAPGHFASTGAMSFGSFGSRSIL